MYVISSSETLICRYMFQSYVAFSIYLDAIGEHHDENRQFRGGTNTGLAWWISETVGKRLRQVPILFHLCLPGSHPAGTTSYPAALSHTESFIWKIYMPTSAPVPRRMYLSWRYGPASGDDFAFVSPDSERERLFRPIILIYGLSKYSPSSRATSDLGDVHCVSLFLSLSSDSEAAKNFIRWKSSFLPLLHPFLPIRKERKDFDKSFSRLPSGADPRIRKH